MRRGLALLVLALPWRAALADGPPPLPEPAHPLLAPLSHADEAAARRVWRPVGHSPPVSVVNVADRQALKMQCNFKRTKLARPCWEGFASLDLAACRGLRLQFF